MFYQDKDAKNVVIATDNRKFTITPKDLNRTRSTVFNATMERDDRGCKGFTMWDDLVEEPEAEKIQRNELIAINNIEECTFSCSTIDWTQHKIFRTNLLLTKLLR